eukprot:CAMPEP_0169083038 /NCGR_PEP_ID=MMETSP1015-20121227/11864_1 /TAXON_ID=342587 /ORGANISM="Karlodinium micrum, Strain CCMP2283" /LENGTH=386 /DNA_ID=CAMNT_0009142933 /DNA_START=94 /DNA_END=1254 /DNA_ORIENTATION=-
MACSVVGSRGGAPSFAQSSELHRFSRIGVPAPARRSHGQSSSTSTSRPTLEYKKVAVPLLHFGAAEEATPIEGRISCAQGTHIPPRRFGQGRGYVYAQREEPSEKRMERPLPLGNSMLGSACSSSFAIRESSDCSVLPPDTSRSLPVLPSSSARPGSTHTVAATSQTRTESVQIESIPVSQRTRPVHVREPSLASISLSAVQEVSCPTKCESLPATDQSSDHDSSNIQTNKSLTSEQLQAYREVEQAEMTCELKRMENMLLEERDRNAKMQNTFAHELMAQRDAHTRDVKALEDVIAKVLEDNRRLSSMVDGLCGQVEKGRRHFGPVVRGVSLKTGTLSSSSGHSRRFSTDSTSSGDGSPSSKEHMPLSSETEMSTDTHISSDEAA